jgi:hypothetical protein
VGGWRYPLPLARAIKGRLAEVVEVHFETGTGDAACEAAIRADLVDVFGAHDVEQVAGRMIRDAAQCVWWCARFGAVVADTDVADAVAREAATWV